MTQSTHNSEPFPVLRAGDIPVDAHSERWLIEDLWSAGAVGLLAGHPKVGKSWLGLDIATSVATGTPCLGHFRVPTPGPALIYLAEDSLTQVRERLAGLARHRKLDLQALDVHVIATPTLRLDLERDCARLLETVRAVRPRLLLLDPLVRLHNRDENNAQEISALLAFLRHLQRTCDLAIVTVHHARKDGSAHNGRALRGSGDLWAFADSALYMQPQRDRVRLAVEHRAASAPKPFTLRLVDDDPHTVHFEIDSESAIQNDHGGLENAVLEALRPSMPLLRAELRSKLRVKNQRLGQVLTDLERRGRIQRQPRGWVLSTTR